VRVKATQRDVPDREANLIKVGNSSVNAGGDRELEHQSERAKIKSFVECNDGG
jgi:hypothetical protein